MNSVINNLYRRVICQSKVNCQFRKLLFTSSVDNQGADQNVSAQQSTDSDKTNLSSDLYYKIKMSGPISIANYMKHVLTHPTKGYYINKDVFGEKGDFITSPELSQIFGEMIAVWIVSECNKIHNQPLQLVELGPGRGTLSRDILRVFNQLNLSDQISLHLVEVSPVLSEIQRKNLCMPEANEGTDDKPLSGSYYKKGKTANNVDVFWYKSVLNLPQGFSIFLAHEFFDALPIYKFQKTDKGWFEVQVDIDPTSETDKKFRFVLSKTEACDHIIPQNDIVDCKRDHIEISFEAMNIIRYISAAITHNGGFSLIIDYGHNGDKTDTFRAFRQHKQCHPLSEPGSADLTADVDFSVLKKVAKDTKNVISFGPVAQRDFLIELGINVRLKNLLKNATEDEKKNLELGYNKIMSPHEMGTCFKVVSMFPYVLKDHFKKFPVYGFQTCHSDY